MLQKKFWSAEFTQGLSPLHAVPLHRVSRYCEQLAAVPRPYAEQFVQFWHTPSFVSPRFRSVVRPGTHWVYSTHDVSLYIEHALWYVPKGHGRLWHTTHSELRAVLPGHWLGGMYSPVVQAEGVLQLAHCTMSWIVLPVHRSVMYWPGAHDVLHGRHVLACVELHCLM